jgi:hypothetical protein
MARNDPLPSSGTPRGVTPGTGLESLAAERQRHDDEAERARSTPPSGHRSFPSDADDARQEGPLESLGKAVTAPMRDAAKDVPPDPLGGTPSGTP